MTTFRQIMTTELVTVDPSITLIEAARAMSAGHAGSVLVVQHGSLVGIFRTEIDRIIADLSDPYSMIGDTDDEPG